MLETRVTDDLEAAAHALRDGKLVAFATETVYGLGAHALDPNAVARVFAAKNRPHFDPLIVHIWHPDQARSLALQIPPLAEQLIDRFWPGPLTLVLPKQAIVPDLVTAGLDSVALRVPDNRETRDLLEAAGIPVAAPSANLFGQVSPTSAQHVADQLAGRIDMIFDGGPCRVGIESTVVRVRESHAELLRLGGLPLEELEAEIGPIDFAPESTQPHQTAQSAPGRLPQHYAPRTPIDIYEWDDPLPTGANGEPLRLGVVTGCQPPITQRDATRAGDDATGCCAPFAVVEVLSASGDLVECAANFFAALRRLDHRGLDRILAVPFPERDLGRALNDRLRRAARR